MRTMKSVGILVLTAVVLAAIGGCKSKDSAGQYNRASKELTLDLGNKVTMRLVQIPAGKFLMGSPKDEKDRQANEGLAPGTWVNGNPQLEVTISKPFYMGVYEVTVNQYAQFVKDTGQEHSEPRFKQTGDHPVVNVTWDDAQAFCKWLSKKTGKMVQLPTEAQWEYACRAGTKTRFGFGDKDENLCKYGNYCDKSNTDAVPWQDKDHNDGFDKTAPVGSLNPNAWGLYDMHGNVWEWCGDWYADSYANAKNQDPTGPDSGACRVLRGGCWGSDPQNCRSAYRGGGLYFNPLSCRFAGRPWSSPGGRFDFVGFRVSVDLK